MEAQNLILDLFAVVNNIENDKQLLTTLRIEDTNLYSKFKSVYTETEKTLNAFFEKANAMEEVRKVAGNKNHTGVIKTLFQYLAANVAHIGENKFTEELSQLNQQSKQIMDLFLELHNLQREL